MNPPSIHQLFRASYVLIITFSIALAFLYTAKFIYPFIIAFALAYLINPFVDTLERRLNVPRIIAIIIVLAVIFSVLAGFITLLIAEIVSGANYLSNSLPQQLAIIIQAGENFFALTVMPFVERLSILFRSLGNEQQTTIIQNIQGIGSILTATIGSFIQDFFQKIPQIIGWFPNVATGFIFSVLATFFISNDYHKIQAFSATIIPKKVKTSIGTVLLDLKKACFGFLKAQFTLVTYTALIVLLGLLILGVEYAITIAFIVALLDLLPYIGSGAVFLPWIVFEVITGNFHSAIGLAILYAAVIIQRQIMEPKILSASIGIPPLPTLIALFAGYKLMGFLGLIVGPIILVIVMTLHTNNVFRDIWIYIQGN